jgi:hypothetical protein
MAPAATRSTVASRYLDIVKKSVLGELYVENELRILYLRQCLERDAPYDPDTLLHIRHRRQHLFDEYVCLRESGMNYEWSLANLGFQHTMVGRARLDNVEHCMQQIVREDVPGDFVECGVWRGGTTVFMRAFLAAHEDITRTVWAADSFEGLPPPTMAEDAGLDLSRAVYPQLAVDLDTVKDTFERYGLLDEQVRFLPGWFRDTLAIAPIRRVSLLRLDGDLYESTMDALDALYARVMPGGFVIIDDYGAIPNCRRAVEEFRNRRGITEPLVQIDYSGVYWRKR